MEFGCLHFRYRRAPKPSNTRVIGTALLIRRPFRPWSLFLDPVPGIVERLPWRSPRFSVLGVVSDGLPVVLPG